MPQQEAAGCQGESANITGGIVWSMNENGSMQTASHTTSMKNPPKLLDQVRYALRTRHYSYRTEKCYIQWIKSYILFHDKRHPAELAENHINQYLTHLAVDKKVAASTQNQSLCAIVFLYKNVLKIDLGDFGPLIWAKKPQRLPVVLSKQEVKQIMEYLHGKTWIIANLLYGSGLRLNECLRLRG